MPKIPLIEALQSGKADKLIEVTTPDQVHELILSKGFKCIFEGHPRKSVLNEFHTTYAYYHPEGHSLTVSFGENNKMVFKHMIENTFSVGNSIKELRESTFIENEVDTETLAKTPPKHIPASQHDIWASIVRKGNHTSYGGAMAHFKRHVFKHGTNFAHAMANESIDQINHIHKVLDDHAKLSGYKKFVPRIMKNGFSGHHVEVDHLNSNGEVNSTSVLTQSDDPHKFLKHAGYKESGGGGSAVEDIDFDSINLAEALPTFHGYKLGQLVKINTRHPTYSNTLTYGSARTNRSGKENFLDRNQKAQQHNQLGIIVGRDSKDDHLQVAIHRHNYGPGQNFSQAIHKDALSAIKHK